MHPVNEDALLPRSVRRYVLDDERVVIATRLHWARLLEPILTTTGAFLVLVFLIEVVGRGSGGHADFLWWLWLIALGRLAVRLVMWRFEWFVATDKRLLLVSGILAREAAMMPLEKVTDLRYSRSILGRLLSYGDFVLESAGQDQAMRHIPWMPSPDDQYRALCTTLFTPDRPADTVPEPRCDAGVVPHQATERRPPSIPVAALDRQVTQLIPVPLRPPVTTEEPDTPGSGWIVSEPTGTFVHVAPPTTDRPS